MGREDVNEQMQLYLTSVIIRLITGLSRTERPVDSGWHSHRSTQSSSVGKAGEREDSHSN